jgi:DNA-binding CsgD family transcriptional regulator
MMGGLESAVILDTIRVLARSPTVGAFIDGAMGFLEGSLAGSLVSFNRIDLINQSATVALRPYRPEHEAAVEGVNELLAEHPIFGWYTTQSDWSPVRISDVVPWEQWRSSRLFVEVLEPIGARHSVFLHLTPPTIAEFVFFAVNRADDDFTDAELGLARSVHPAFVALYTALSSGGGGVGANDIATGVTLTRRERVVLGYLADGLTAEAIARQLAASPATVRKHLQNLYAKLGTSDRLGAVIRGRDLGLLHADELSRAFRWNIRFDMKDTQ